MKCLDETNIVLYKYVSHLKHVHGLFSAIFTAAFSHSRRSLAPGLQKHFRGRILNVTPSDIKPTKQLFQ